MKIARIFAHRVELPLVEGRGIHWTRMLGSMSLELKSGTNRSRLIGAVPAPRVSTPTPRRCLFRAGMEESGVALQRR